MAWLLEEKVRRMLLVNGFTHDNGNISHTFPPEELPLLWKDSVCLSSSKVLVGLARKLNVQVTYHEISEKGIRRKIGLIYRDGVNIYTHMGYS